MNTILLIDDDDQLRKSFCRLLADENYTVLSAASGEEGLELVRTIPLDLVLLDLRLPGISGMETFDLIRAHDTNLPVIIITAFGTTEVAIQATRKGAYDYVLKPFDVQEMLELISGAVEAGHFMRAPVKMDEIPALLSGDAIIGQSRGMQKIYKTIGRVAQTDATVLITGESGTGKEMVARAVYQHGLRSGNPFVIINCVAIPETLLESELFGYEKGAFTGAVRRHLGKIEQANTGTVFLDEIGDMPLNIQSKILRLLQERKIERLGGRETIPVDVRIIAATNKNLEQAISRGTFREDLYFRLKVVSIDLPPLRERREDIPRIVTHYLKKFSSELKIDNPGIQKEAMATLESHAWPGNVRELANLIHKVLIFNRGAPVSRSDLKALLEPQRDQGQGDEGDALRRWVRTQLSRDREETGFDQILDQVSELIVLEALTMTGGNRSQAAKLLKLSRPTLHAKMAKHKISLTTIAQNQ